MKKQLRVFTSLIFLGVLAFFCIGCAGLKDDASGTYCTSGTNTCSCRKQKPKLLNAFLGNYVSNSFFSEEVCEPVVITSESTKLMTVTEYSQAVNQPASSKTIGKTESSRSVNESVSTKTLSGSEYSKSSNEPASIQSVSKSEYSSSTGEPASTKAATKSDTSKFVNESTSTKTTSASNYAKSSNEPATVKSVVKSDTSRTVSEPVLSKTITKTVSSKAISEPASSKTVTKLDSSKSVNESVSTKTRSGSEYSNSVNQPKSTTAFNSTDYSRAMAQLDNSNMNSTDYNNSGRTSSRSRESSSQNTLAVKGCKYAPTCEFSTGVVVRVKNPKICMLGSEYAVEIEVLATVDVNDVVLTATLPEGVSYVSSQSQAKVSGRELTWNFDHINQGQTVLSKIMLKSEKQGELCTCVSVKSTATGCCSIMCAKPYLTCEKTGPEEVCPGEQFTYVVTVTNSGSYPAENVVLDITDTMNAQKPANYKIGTLESGQSKKINFPVTATKRGKLCFTAVASSTNANQATCDLCTLVTSCAVECRKEGPQQAIIGQVADYQITVSNTGDRVLHDVVVTDSPHPSYRIISAQGAELAGKKAIWKIKELKAGEKATFKESLTSRSTGKFTSSTAVTNREGYSTGCDFTTSWRGRAALDVSMSTSENSIFVGETTKHRITVTNQGQEPDSNVVVTVIFPAGLEPVDASGDSVGKIDGQNIVFAPTNLALRQTLEYFVTVKANGRGDLRPKVQVSSDSIKAPITQEESLIVN